MALKDIYDVCKARKSSKLTDTSVESLVSLDEKELVQELDEMCPVLSAALDGFMESNNTIGPKAACYGIIFKTRYFMLHLYLSL